MVSRMWEIKLSIPLEDVKATVEETDQRLKDLDSTLGPHRCQLRVSKRLPLDPLEARTLQYLATVFSETKYMTGNQAAQLMKKCWKLQNNWMSTPVKRRPPRKPRKTPTRDVHWFTVPCKRDDYSDSDSSIDTIFWDYESCINGKDDPYLLRSPF